MVNPEPGQWAVLECDRIDGQPVYVGSSVVMHTQPTRHAAEEVLEVLTRGREGQVILPKVYLLAEIVRMEVQK